MQKTIQILIVFFVALTLALPVFAQEATPSGAHYNVKVDGTFRVSVALVNEVEGRSPQLRCAAKGWTDIAMKKEGDLWVANIGRRINPSLPVEWCVAVGGNRFLPHEAVIIGSEKINGEHIKDNGVGGYNFLTKPLP